MNQNDPGHYQPATLLSLGSHKGNLIRLGLRFSSGQYYFVEPLSCGAGGIIFDYGQVREVLPLSREPLGFGLVTNDARLLGEFEAPGDLVGVQSLVLYPSGRVWEGEIYQGDLARSAALIWNWDLAWHLNMTNRQANFGMGSHWRDVPTIVGIIPSPSITGIGSAASACRFIEHTCPKQCEDRSKFLPDPKFPEYPRAEFSIPDYRQYL